MKKENFTNNNFGSDGGSIATYSNAPSIGYSDGVPFISAATPYEPFPTAKKSIKSTKPIDSKEKMCGISYGYFANRGEIIS